MILSKSLKALEFDKVSELVKGYAVLKKTKEDIVNYMPSSSLVEVKKLLSETKESFDLLFKYSVGGVQFFDDLNDVLQRVDAGGTLNNGELLSVAENLRSARILKTSIQSVDDSSLTIIPEIASRIYVNYDFEKEIGLKIISQEEVSDNASPNLFALRKKIRDINAKIREELNSFMRGGYSKYLQESVVTMRQDRYVIPVKSEYRSQIRGFIHDQSSSGSTVFIEPEVVMDLNNELKKTMLDETEEIHRILVDLTNKVSFMTDALRYNGENISYIDLCYARASYSFYNKCSYPKVNDKGIVDIKRGRHPLISKDKVVPVSFSLGKEYNFLLVTGPNTGGKTVTLKMLGLFSVMAMCGLFLPCDDDSEISIFNGIFCDIGDEQSIEQDLSTFSSHIKNLISIIDNIDDKSLVLLDEIGAGTDPDEGSALALSIIKKLLKTDCFGIITTHYSKLKEFAMNNEKIENASMEFDAKTLKPLYRIIIGIPGSSNAIDIAKTLGLDEEVVNEAYGYLSDDKVSFENVLRKAEESRMEAERLSEKLKIIEAEKEKTLKDLTIEKEKITAEKEKIHLNAKSEVKRIVADRLEEAEEIIYELKDILKRANLESKELFKASELKNRLMNSKYLENEDYLPSELINVEPSDLKVGSIVFVKSLGNKGKVIGIKNNKKEVEVLIGDIKTTVKFNDLYNKEDEKKQKKSVKINKTKVSNNPVNRLNVIGKTSLEALSEVEFFIDSAIVNGLDEVTIIHGVGEGILLKTIREYLKNNKNVKEYRRGIYGEGENGVTVVKLK